MDRPERGSHKDILNNHEKHDPEIISSPVFGPVFTMSSTLDYRKAERQFRKATKNRPANIEQEWTPFRVAEKRFKARFPPPDISSVLDLASADESRAPEIELGRWVGSSIAVDSVKISLKENIYTIPHIPGAPHITKSIKCSWSEIDRPGNITFLYFEREATRSCKMVTRTTCTPTQ